VEAHGLVDRQVAKMSKLIPSMIWSPVGSSIRRSPCTAHPGFRNLSTSCRWYNRTTTHRDGIKKLPHRKGKPVSQPTPNAPRSHNEEKNRQRNIKFACFFVIFVVNFAVLRSRGTAPSGRRRELQQGATPKTIRPIASEKAHACKLEKREIAIQRQVMPPVRYRNIIPERRFSVHDLKSCRSPIPGKRR
jgi:hypothetical protein